MNHERRMRNRESAERSIEIGKQFYEKGDKPMKATIIYYLKDEPHTDDIHINRHQNIAEAVSSWCIEMGCAPRYVHFVHYDGMLFEYTSKPVLAEVGTGIEI